MGFGKERWLSRTEVQNLEPIGSLELKVHTKKVVSSKFGHVPFLLLNPFNIMKEA